MKHPRWNNNNKHQCWNNNIDNKHQHRNNNNKHQRRNNNAETTIINTTKVCMAEAQSYKLYRVLLGCVIVLRVLSCTRVVSQKHIITERAPARQHD